MFGVEGEAEIASAVMEKEAIRNADKRVEQESER